MAKSTCVILLISLAYKICNGQFVTVVNFKKTQNMRRQEWCAGKTGTINDFSWSTTCITDKIISNNKGNKNWNSIRRFEFTCCLAGGEHDGWATKGVAASKNSTQEEEFNKKHMDFYTLFRLRLGSAFYTISDAMPINGCMQNMVKQVLKPYMNACVRILSLKYEKKIIMNGYG